MGFLGDMAREGATQFYCQKVVEKIEKYQQYSEAVKALKELGIEMLNTLPNVPEWTDKYYKIFRSLQKE